MSVEYGISKISMQKTLSIRCTINIKREPTQDVAQSGRFMVGVRGEEVGHGVILIDIPITL